MFAVTLRHRRYLHAVCHKCNFIELLGVKYVYDKLPKNLLQTPRWRFDVEKRKKKLNFIGVFFAWLRREVARAIIGGCFFCYYFVQVSQMNAPKTNPSEREFAALT